MAYEIISGKEFNTRFNGVRFVKLTNKIENHYNFQYKDGLNIDTIPLTNKKECEVGGLYFTEFNKFLLYLNNNVYIRDVKIPDDANVCILTDKFKSDKIFLEERTSICDLKEWNDKKFCLEAVKRSGFALQFIKEQDREICLEAVKQIGSKYNL